VAPRRRLGSCRGRGHPGHARTATRASLGGAVMWRARAAALPRQRPPRQAVAPGPDSPSSLLTALGDLSCIVLSVIGWSAARANSHYGNWAHATASALFRTKGDDGGRCRRRRQVNRAFCLVPLAAPLGGSGGPIGGTFLGRQRWDTSLFGPVATGLCYTTEASSEVTAS